MIETHCLIHWMKLNNGHNVKLTSITFSLKMTIYVRNVSCPRRFVHRLYVVIVRHKIYDLIQYYVGSNDYETTKSQS